jgi:hypothetical protein
VWKDWAKFFRECADARGVKPATALTRLLNFAFSFETLVSTNEAIASLDGHASFDAPLRDVCFSMVSRMDDLRDSAEKAQARGRSYSPAAAKTDWVQTIAEYAVAIRVRIVRGEKLLNSESVTIPLSWELDRLFGALEALVGSDDWHKILERRSPAANGPAPVAEFFAA